jgi:hypothetical protein
VKLGGIILGLVYISGKERGMGIGNRFFREVGWRGGGGKGLGKGSEEGCEGVEGWKWE